MNEVNLNNNVLKCSLILRLDDIAPNMNWKMMNKVKNLFNKYNLKPIIGVIPNNEDIELKSYPECNFKFWDEIKNLQNQGWEIAMHGYRHLYSPNCTNDYLGHGGNTEFANDPFDAQIEKIKLGLEIFKKENIKVKTFFAPNHTFDYNTLRACKEVGINSIVDGYGIAPYHENGLNFFPQLFYKLFIIPFGFQTIQIHLNYYSEEDFKKFEKFIEKNYKKIITFSEASSMIKNTVFCKITKYIIEKALKTKRLIF